MMYVLFGCDIIILGLVILRFGSLPPQLPLFYSRPWGEEQLIDWWMIFIVPIFLNILYFLNLFIYKKFFFENLFIKKIIDFFNIFLILSLTGIFIKILLLVT